MATAAECDAVCYGQQMAAVAPPHDDGGAVAMACGRGPFAEHAGTARSSMGWTPHSLGPEKLQEWGAPQRGPVSAGVGRPNGPQG